MHADAEPTGATIFKEAASMSITGTVMPILREYGFLIAGGMLVLGTVLVILLIDPAEAPEK